MDVYRLLGDELTYELVIRGIEIDVNTVANKRILLRNALIIERSNAGLTPKTATGLSVTTEIALCSQKLEELSAGFEECDFGRNENDRRRLNTRLTHVSLRLGRLSSTCREEQIEIDRLTTICNHLLEVLNLSRVPGLSPESLESDHVQLESPPLIELEVDGPQTTPIVQTRSPHFVTPARAPNTVGYNDTFSNQIEPLLQDLASVSLNSYKFPLAKRSVPAVTQPVRTTEVFRKWDISFDGKNSILSFLERIDELRESRGVDRDRLYQSAAELFTGDALLWFRANRSTFRNWDELVHCLRRDFLPYDFEHSIWDAIRKRTQGEGERLIIYVAVMESLFSRLSTKPEERIRVEWIRRNLLPVLQNQLALCSIQTLEELTRLGRAAEDTHLRAKSFIPPPSKCLVEPELGVHRPKPGHVSLVESLEPASTLAIDRRTNPPGDTSTQSRSVIICWKCDKPGHRAADCRSKPGVMCYRCKTPNVTVRNCPHCNNLQSASSGNGAARQQ